MAALVTNLNFPVQRHGGVSTLGPTKVALADETNLGTPDTSVILDTKGVSMVSVQIIFANYASVTVKAQRSLDGINYFDISEATASATNTGYQFDPKAPWVRLSIAGTLSGSADSMSVWVYMEHMN